MYNPSNHAPKQTGGPEASGLDFSNAAEDQNNPDNRNQPTSVQYRDIFYIESVMERMLDEFTCKNLGFGEVIHSYTVLLLTVLARNYLKKHIDGIF